MRTTADQFRMANGSMAQCGEPRSVVGWFQASRRRAGSNQRRAGLPRVCCSRSALAGSRRLLVLDNAANTDLIRPFLPAAGRAHVIVTSSNQALTSLGVPVPVDVF